jgi:hypothetical protein
MIHNLVTLLFPLLFQFILANELPLSDFPGCPENSICKKETGVNRSEWLLILKKLEQNKITEKIANQFLLQSNGFPIPMWASEEAIKKPFTVLWDSPCKQHKILNNKTYIAISFIKKLLPKNNILFHSPAILNDDKKIPHPLMVIRGDAPLYIINDSLYYTQDDDGHYYGLLISPQGNISITKTISDSHFPREVSCSKEQVEMFSREIPSPNFFQGYYCKEIWNTKTKYYQSILIGWSCN